MFQLPPSLDNSTVAISANPDLAVKLVRWSLTMPIDLHCISEVALLCIYLSFMSFSLRLLCQI